MDPVNPISHIQEAAGSIPVDPAFAKSFTGGIAFSVPGLAADHSDVLSGLSAVMGNVHVSSSTVLAAVNMQRSVDALGPALSEIESPVSPQLARSLQATEVAWKDMDAEFGLLSSTEVSERVGSRSPNRSYASEQRAKGNLLAIKRPGGLRYPGYQIDPREHTIRPVMHDLIQTATEAGVTESDLALWLCIPTGYLDGGRPVDRFDEPAAVTEAARQSFNVQW
jgi:hypothetical protein